MLMPIGIGVVVAAAIGGAAAYRQRKKSALKLSLQAGKQDDIESVLDSHKGNIGKDDLK